MTRQVEPARLADIVAEAFRELLTRNRLDVPEDMIRERARDAAMTVLGEYELRHRDAADPVLLAVDGGRVVSVDTHAPDANTAVETTRLTVFEPVVTVQLTTASTTIVMAALKRAGHGGGR